MSTKKITLTDIDKAIKSNCIVEYNAPKALTLKKGKGQPNGGIGRSLFIYFALKIEYTPEEIFDYLGITEHEYKSKSAVLSQMYDNGKLLFEHPDAQSDVNENELFFYRKLVLIGNYLRYRFEWQQ